MVPNEILGKLTADGDILYIRANSVSLADTSFS